MRKGYTPVIRVPLMVAGTPYLAVANYQDGSTTEVDSTLYKWDGSTFAVFQSFPTSAALGWESFVIAGTSFLAVANHYNDSTYKVNWAYNRVKIC